MKIPTAAKAPSRSANGAQFPTSKGGPGVKVSSGKGGVDIGTPTHCTSTRKAFETGTRY